MWFQSRNWMYVIYYVKTSIVDVTNWIQYMTCLQIVCADQLYVKGMLYVWGTNT